MNTQSKIIKTLKVKNFSDLKQKTFIKGFDKNILFAVMIMLSFAAVFHKLNPINLFGASLFYIIVPYFLMVFIFIKNVQKMRISDIAPVFFILFSALIIILLRSIVYSENLTDLINGSIYILFIPVTFLVFNNLYLSKSDLILFRTILLVIILINLLNSLLYSSGNVFFETMFEDSEFYIADSRFSGLYGGSNLSSSALLILTLIYLFTVNKFKVLQTLVISILFFVTVLPNLSRGPIFIFVISLFLYLIYNIKYSVKNIFYVIFFILMLISIGAYLKSSSIFENNIGSFSERTQVLDGENGRFDRLILTFNLLYENGITFFIGIKGENQTKSEFLNISDNSVTLLLANFGIIFTTLFLGLIAKFIKMYKTLEKNKIIFTIAVVGIGVINNSVLWTAWVFYVILGYKLISVSEEFRRNKALYSK